MYFSLNKDILFLLVAWFISIVMLILFIPKNKVRQAQLVFLFHQATTMLIGILVADYGLIEYPVRLFMNTTNSNFSFEYFIYPSISAIFNVNYPDRKSPWKQFLYYFYFCTVMTIIEVLFENYTNILKYIHWTWYITWITLFLTLFISRKYYTWFFRPRDTKEESCELNTSCK